MFKSNVKLRNQITLLFIKLFIIYNNMCKRWKFKKYKKIV